MAKKKKRKHTPPRQNTSQPNPVKRATAKRKAVIGISILVALLVVGGVWAAIKLYQGTAVSASQTSDQQVSSPPQTQKPREDNKIVVYYFHGTYRCPSCTMIEQYTEQAVLEGFSPELKRGLVEFKSINAETPENRHFIKDYQLYTKSVIVSEVINGREQRWKNLQKVWQLFYNKKAFTDYVQQEIYAYLKEKHS